MKIIARLQAPRIRVINAIPYYRAARSKGMVNADGIHLNAQGQDIWRSNCFP